MSISPKQLAALGWKRSNPGAYPPTFEHVDGWHLQHCGHPTANFPYMLYTPEGAAVTAPNGRGFQNVNSAVEWLQPTLAISDLDHIQAEAEQANDEAQVEELNRILRTPLANISDDAGEMERNSPLFFGKGDNPTLF